MTPNEDHTGKEGYAVNATSGKAALATSATDLPIGIIVEGGKTTGYSSVAIPDGFNGTLRVKLDATPGTVALGTKLAITTTGTFKADPTSGGRTLMATALESGSAGELVEAAIFTATGLT